jgi:Putative zinc-finger
MDSSTDTRLPMEGCPPLEDIAALLDDTLPAEERARVTEHLAGCESCYEIFLGAVHFQEDSSAEDTVLEDTGGRGVLHFPLGGKQEKATRRWLPLAASVVLVVALGGIGWQFFFSPPSITVASLAEPLAGKPGVPSSLYQGETTRGGDDPGDFLGDTSSFMAGVYLVDLRLSVHAGDVARTRSSLQNLGNAVKEIVLLGSVGDSYLAAYAAMEDADDLKGFAPQLPAKEAALEADLADSGTFPFGLWAEAGRLSAVTKNPAFFDRRANRRFLSHLLNAPPEQGLAPELQEPVLDDLKAIERTWEKGDLSGGDYQALATHFQKIIRRIDDYEEEPLGAE